MPADSDDPTLFPEPQTVVTLEQKNTGVLPYQALRNMVRAKEIVSLTEPIDESQYQPASLDLRLGRYAYRVRASFLPGPKATVMDLVPGLDGMPPIDLAGGAVLERGAVYVVELMEQLQLKNGLEGFANPKSSTGRLDVLTRLIADRSSAFDRVEKGYTGPLYLEVAPLSFSVRVAQGSRLNQIRFQRGQATVSKGEMDRLYNSGQLVRAVEGRLPLRAEELVPVSVDLRGATGVIGYRARKNTSKIDIDRINHYDPREFWEKVEPTGGRLNLDEGDFYILATREEVGVPAHLAAEMVPYDSSSGEFRVHYAGFFDPGFGWDGQAGGSRAVLEVRSYGVPFTLEHGQIVGWLRYSRLAGGKPPDRVYGVEIRSNYQGQGVALAKQFKTWPR